jgi:hypothetical protein
VRGVPIDDSPSMAQAVTVPGIGEEALIGEVQQRLIQRYADLTPHTVSAAVEAALTRFARSSVRDFVPLLVERRASAELSKQSATSAPV